MTVLLFPEGHFVFSTTKLRVVRHITYRCDIIGETDYETDQPFRLCYINSWIFLIHGSDDFRYAPEKQQQHTKLSSIIMAADRSFLVCLSVHANNKWLQHTTTGAKQIIRSNTRNKKQEHHATLTASRVVDCRCNPCHKQQPPMASSSSPPSSSSLCVVNCCSPDKKQNQEHQPLPAERREAAITPC